MLFITATVWEYYKKAASYAESSSFFPSAMQSKSVSESDSFLQEIHRELNYIQDTHSPSPFLIIHKLFGLNATGKQTPFNFICMN